MFLFINICFGVDRMDAPGKTIYYAGIKKSSLKIYDSLSFRIKSIGVFGASKNSNSISNLSQKLISNDRAN